MHVQTVLVDTSLLHNAREMFLLFTAFKFVWKNVVSGKIKVHLPQLPQALQQLFCPPPPFLILFKIFLAPPPFKKESRDYTFYMRKYKVVTIKLLPFYLTNFLFTELQSHNI